MDSLPETTCAAKVRRRAARPERRASRPSTAPRCGGKPPIDSLLKFDPRTQIRNPVMFVVWLGALVTAALTIYPDLFGPSDASAAYNGAGDGHFAVDRLVCEFCGGAGRRPGQGEGRFAAADQDGADGKSLERSGRHEQVPAAALRKDDLVRVEQGRTHSGRR